MKNPLPAHLRAAIEAGATAVADFTAATTHQGPLPPSAFTGPMTRSLSNQIKHSLRQQGYTLKAWAEAKGFKYRDVSEVLRGVRRGNYGAGRDICLALGINPDAEDRLAA